MLTEAEFEELVALSIPNENSASRFYRHDRAQRAEIERLKTELATATDRADKIEGWLAPLAAIRALVEEVPRG